MAFTSVHGVKLLAHQNIVKRSPANLFKDLWLGIELTYYLLQNIDSLIAK